MPDSSCGAVVLPSVGVMENISTKHKITILTRIIARLEMNLVKGKRCSNINTTWSLEEQEVQFTTRTESYFNVSVNAMIRMKICIYTR